MTTTDGLTLDRFLRAVPALDVQQLLAISAAHETVGAQALERARNAAGVAARAANVLDELHDLHGTIIQWAGSHNSPSGMWTREAAFPNPIVNVLHDVRVQAQPALLDAATALFLVETLPHDAFDTLVGPVDSVLG